MLTLGTTGSMVKIMKEENDVTHILPECLNILAYPVFFELSYSSSNDNLKTPILLMKSPKSILQLVVRLSSQPFDHVGNV
jgi:hypothetical protein